MGLGRVVTTWLIHAVGLGPYSPQSPQDRARHRAEVARRHRPHETTEARLASYLGTGLESPHISNMTPPPDRPLEDKDNDRA